MNDGIKGTLLYVGGVTLCLASMFAIVANNLMGDGHTSISVDPQKHEITRKKEHHIGYPYYSDSQTITAVFNLDSGTKTVTDSHTTAAGLLVTDNSKPAQTTPVTDSELADLGRESTEAAQLIATLRPHIK
jgi:hypothetical protein